MRISPKLAGLALALAAIPSLAHAWSWSTTNRFGTFSSGGYTIYADEWGSSNTQHTYANSGTNFAANGSWSGGGVKSYPHNQKSKSGSPGSLGSGNVGGLSSPGGSFEWAYDNWQPQEVMIWIYWTGSVGPIGSYKTTATVGGRSWNVYNGGSNVTSFLANSKYTGGSTSLGSIGSYVQSHYGGSSMRSVQFGPEITSGGGTWTVGSSTF